MFFLWDRFSDFFQTRDWFQFRVGSSFCGSLNPDPVLNQNYLVLKLLYLAETSVLLAIKLRIGKWKLSINKINRSIGIPSFKFLKFNSNVKCVQIDSIWNFTLSPDKIVNIQVYKIEQEIDREREREREIDKHI